MAVCHLQGETTVKLKAERCNLIIHTYHSDEDHHLDQNHYCRLTHHFHRSFHYHNHYIVHVCILRSHQVRPNLYIQSHCQPEIVLLCHLQGEAMVMLKVECGNSIILTYHFELEDKP